MTNTEATEKLELLTQSVDEDTSKALIFGIKALNRERQGEWKDDGKMMSCSVCGRYRIDNRYGHLNYCNHCGASMYNADCVI